MHCPVAAATPVLPRLVGEITHASLPPSRFTDRKEISNSLLFKVRWDDPGGNGLGMWL